MEGLRLGVDGEGGREIPPCLEGILSAQAHITTSCLPVLDPSLDSVYKCWHPLHSPHLPSPVCHHCSFT
eukprot:2735661-Rhodomonas_salina.1